MKISPNFDLREWIPKSLYDRFGDKSIWFVDKELVKIAEFYKSFFLCHYQQTNGPQVVNVLVVINNWHYGGARQQSGIRTADSNVGATHSQHKYKSAFDCKLIIKFKDGTSISPDYKEVHKVIKDNEKLFLDAGVTTLEHPDYAKTWLHTDTRWVWEQTEILIVKP